MGSNCELLHSLRNFAEQSRRHSGLLAVGDLLPVPDADQRVPARGDIGPLPEAGLSTLACRPQSLPEETIHSQVPVLEQPERKMP